MPASWSPILVYFGITVILGMMDWTGLARAVRAKLFSLREEDYVLAAQLMGARTPRILMSHLIPGFISHLIASATITIPAMILGETALSFLGLGLRPPIVSWGVMLNEAQNMNVVSLYPWLLLPVAPVILVILAFNFMGDGLRDAAGSLLVLMRIAFHAPLKAPDHPVPSGDRQMARLLVAALRAGGHDVDVVSTFRSFLPMPEPERMCTVEAEAGREAARLAALWDVEDPPDLWFTYHAYYKAPDLLGPRLAACFGLPYACAEASHAGKRARGLWAGWHAANEAAIRAADRHLCFTPRDAEGLAGLVDPARIAMLPPFIAAGPFGAVERAPRRPGPARLVTVAMMRAGDKARSYAVLAAALGALPAALQWHLTIVGDGPDRASVAAMFAGLPPERLAWAGECDAAGVADALAMGDLYVWPGFGEAYGIAYLEAAAAGLPVLAMDCGGIGSVVTDGVTGRLTPEDDLDAFVDALAGLIADPGACRRLGEAGRAMVLGERTVERAAGILSRALDGLGDRR